MSFLYAIKSKSASWVFLLTLFICSLFAPSAGALASQAEEELTAKLVEGAKKEGQLLLYHSMNVQEGDKLLKRFQEKYPFIKTEMVRSDSQAGLNKILAEDRAKKHLCDVMSFPAMSIEVLKRKNLLAKYLSPNGKSYPEEFKDPDGYWISNYFQLHVMAYNTRLIAPKEVPRSYEDFLGPKWKGKIGMDANAFYWFAGVLKIMGEEKGLQYMKKLSDQNIRFDGRILVVQLVAAGETSITMPVYNHRIEQMKSDGAPLEWSALEPLIAEVNAPSISAHAPHPHTARLFIDFLLSKEGQEIIASFYRLPTRSDVEARIPRAKAKGMKILPFDPAITDNYEKYVKLYREVLMKKQPR